MARVELAQAVLISVAGAVQVGAGASVQVNIRGGGGAATVYADSSSGSTLSNPLTADSAGRIEGWVDQANDYDLVISGSGFSTYTQPFVIPRGSNGAAGSPGVGANWRGVWNSGTTYAVGDGVYRNGLPYIGNSSSNLNHDPISDNGTNWGALFTSPSGVDVWNTQSAPASVTDWGPVINALISGGAKHLRFGEHSFPFSTKIDMSGTTITGVVLAGAGARSWDRPDQNPTKLIWKGGASSGTAIDMRSSSGCELRGLAVLYDNSAYNGDLIDMGFVSGSQGSGHKLEQVGLSSTGSAARSARSLLRLDGGVGHTFRDMTLNGAGTLVRGLEASGTIANQMLFDNVMLENWTTGAAANGGFGWLFTSCCFEFSLSPTNARAFITDAAWAGNALPDVYFTNDTTFWDYNQTGQGVVTTTAAHGTIYLTFRDCNVEQAGHNAFLCPSPGGLTLENVKGFTGMSTGDGPFIDLTGSAKDWVVIRDVPQFNVNGADLDELIHGLTAGHHWIDVWGSGSAEIARGMRTQQGQERQAVSANSWAKPSIAAATGQTGLTVTVKGNDHKGYILLTGNANAGDLATVTFAKPLIGGFQNITHVVLGLPVQGYDGFTINPDIFYSSQVYAKLISQNDLTGFKVACVTGWTSKTLAIPYEAAVLI